MGVRRRGALDREAAVSRRPSTVTGAPAPGGGGRERPPLHKFLRPDDAGARARLGFEVPSTRQPAAPPLWRP